MIPRLHLSLPAEPVEDLSNVTAIMRVHHLRENKVYPLEILASDMPAIYGDRLPTLLRGRAVVMGGLMHKVARVQG